MKSPQMDSFILPIGEQVQLRTIYHSAGPAGMKLIVDGERVNTRSLPPWSSEAVLPISPDEPGDYTVQLIVEAASLSEIRKIREGKQPEERVVASASWQITVVKKDELSQSDIDEFKRRVADATVVYTLFSIAYKVYSNWRTLADRISDALNTDNPEEGPQSTIADFTESDSSDENEDEDKE